MMAIVANLAIVANIVVLSNFARFWKGTEAYYGGDFGKFADSVRPWGVTDCSHTLFVNFAITSGEKYERQNH